eukprot:NODE_5267_length_1790_cov_3.877330.p1 GENE.NODE_5267_length_1790_cov_3.877330~~NODE_5267_length_1790_cov_3.877330.p1  ORF type:complete len:427 (-),score=108.15 NODE_5267_length_1790_cov_3.877330:329-1609(-)
MLLWALAALDSPGVVTVVPQGLFLALAEEAGRRVKQLRPRELANIAWAFATRRMAIPDWLRDELPRRAEAFRPQECANMLWAFANSSVPVEDLLVALSYEVGSSYSFAAWKAQEMANAAWALAHSTRRSETLPGLLRWGPPALRSVHLALAERVDELNGQELAMVAATLRFDLEGQEALLARVAERATALLAEKHLLPDAIVQLLDALEVGAVEVPNALAEAFERLCMDTLAIMERLEAADREDNPAERKAALRDIQALRLTTLGTRGTSWLLHALALDSAPEAEPRSWPLAAADRSPSQTRCLLDYRLEISRGADSSGADATISQRSVFLQSGGAPDKVGAGALKPVVLRFARGRDAEFLALSVVVGAVRRAADELGLASTAWETAGDVQLHVSNPPCLSCVAAMVQFKQLFPAVCVSVSFESAG